MNALDPDEFDLIPDPFAGENIDWNQVLAPPIATQANPPSSPEYFADDSALDESILAQLDMLDSIHRVYPQLDAF